MSLATAYNDLQGCHGQSEGGAPAERIIPGCCGQDIAVLHPQLDQCNAEHVHARGAGAAHQ